MKETICVYVTRLNSLHFHDAKNTQHHFTLSAPANRDWFSNMSNNSLNFRYQRYVAVLTASRIKTPPEQPHLPVNYKAQLNEEAS